MENSCLIDLSGPGSRTAYLDHMRQRVQSDSVVVVSCSARDAGLRVLRIFIISTTHNYKSSGSQAHS